MEKIRPKETGPSDILLKLNHFIKEFENIEMKIGASPIDSLDASEKFFDLKKGLVDLNLVDLLNSQLKQKNITEKILAEDSRKLLSYELAKNSLDKLLKIIIEPENSNFDKNFNKLILETKGEVISKNYTSNKKIPDEELINSKIHSYPFNLVKEKAEKIIEYLKHIKNFISL